MRLPAKRIMREFKINEISAVDNPAQEGARAVLLKRDDLAAKAASGSADETLTVINDQPEEKSMTDQNIETLKAELAKAQTLLAMSSDERAYYDGLGEKAQEAFLAKSADKRASEVKKSADAKAVVYEDADGNTYTKADDQRLIDLAKARDELVREKQELAKSSKEAELAKRASELQHLPGDDATRIAILKSIDSIEDDAVREAAFTALKARDAGVAKAFEQVGHAGPPEKQSAEQKIEAMAKAYADEHKVTKAKAFAAVLLTDEGRKLYAETR